MADFAHWAVAAEPALPWPEGTFLAAYQGNRQKAVEVSLDADSVACALRALVDEQGEVEGTNQELLDLLTNRQPERVRGSRGWPSSPRGLSSRVDRAAPALRQVGIEIHRDREPGSGRRIIRLVRPEAAPVRHNRHDRHEAPASAASDRDAELSPVTVDATDRHSEEGPSTGPRDGCDDRDGQAPALPPPTPPPPPDDEELRL